MASLENVFQHLKTIPPGRMTGLLAVIIVSITGMLLLFSWIQEVDYQVLYSNLSEDDAGRIVQELKDKKIPYQLGSSGTVRVSSDQVYDLRLQLASQGLPQGGSIGFEIFDNTSFTTSEFVQKLNFRRALEGELGRTIKSLSGVQQGRVHLAIPDKSVFAFQEDKPKPSAAVFVTLQQGRKLNRSEVEGIVHLVSSSVEDLGPQDITVIDNKGSLLTKPSDDGMISLTSSQMEYQQTYEKNMISKIVSILEPVAGRGKVNAKVSATFDFTRSERTEEKYDPDGVVVRSEQKSTEKTTTGSRGGIPGVASNNAGGSSQTSSSAAGLSQKQDEMINYETSKTITRVIESPISLERLSVAILVDGVIGANKGNGENADQGILRSEEDVKYYEDMVKKTVGFSADRGDEISVTVMPFRELEGEETAAVERDYMPFVITIGKYSALVITAILFFLFVIRPLISSLTRAVPHSSGSPASQESRNELEAPLKPKEIPLERQVIDWAQNNTAQATGLVKGWIEE